MASVEVRGLGRPRDAKAGTFAGLERYLGAYRGRLVLVASTKRTWPFGFIPRRYPSARFSSRWRFTTFSTIFISSAGEVGAPRRAMVYRAMSENRDHGKW